MADVRTGAGRDVLKVWLYAAAAVVLGGWTSPFFYNAGKAMGEVTVGKPTNGLLKWLGAVCRESEFPAFFLAAMIGMAVLLFLPFTEWLDMRRAGRGLRIGQPLRKNPRGPLELVTGLLLSAGLFLLIGYGLLSTGSFTWLGMPGGTGRGWLWNLLPGIVLMAVFQEWLFRGVALGIFLRAMRPMAAILLMAALFALVHSLKPPAGMNVPDPDGDGGGFVLLKMIGMRLADPNVLMTELLPLAAMGGVLGYARWRTASLWMPIGLHAGWHLANVLFVRAAKPVPRTDPLATLLSGHTLAEGLIPLAGVLVAGALVFFIANASHAETEAND